MIKIGSIVFEILWQQIDKNVFREKRVWKLSYIIHNKKMISPSIYTWTIQYTFFFFKKVLQSRFMFSLWNPGFFCEIAQASRWTVNARTVLSRWWTYAWAFRPMLSPKTSIVFRIDSKPSLKIITAINVAISTIFAPEWRCFGAKVKISELSDSLLF